MACGLLIPALILQLQHASAQQLTGVKTIPGNYATISAAITDLNANGVGNGGVTFNIMAGYTETISATLSLTATGTAGNPIVFQKSGSGANPLITAYTGGTGTPGTATQDGIWRLVGSDYVTIDGIDLTDNAANTANPATMEYGYAMYKASVTDGCQNNTIKNCVVTLNRLNNAAGTAPMVDGSVGIIMINTTATAATTALTPTAASGSNSKNKFYSNTLQNCNIGIALIGYAAPSPYALGDTLNDIGGTSVATGNQVLNYGGGGTASAAAGIRTLAQWALNVSYNTVNNNNGSGVNHASTLRGILINTAAGASATITYNTVTIQGGGTTSQLTAIENASGSTANGNTVNISNNTITNCTYTTATSGVFYGIYNNAASPANLTISNNSFLNNTTAATSGSYYTIYNSGSVTTTNNITNNIINGITFTATSTSLTHYTIYNTSGGSSSTANLNGNTFQNISFTGTTGGTGTIKMIYSTASPGTCNIQNNTVGALTLKTTGGIYLFHETASSPANITGNTATAGLTRTGTSGSFYGIYNDASLTSSGTVDVSNNNISNISNGASTSTVYMVYWSTNATQNIYNNTFSNISAASGTGTFYGIYPYFYGTTLNMYNNTVSNVTYAGTLYGMYFYGYYHTGASIYNNTFSNLTTSGTTNTAIFLYETGNVSTGTYGVYGNKITDLTSTSATASGVCGININSQYGGTVNTYNNVIANLTAPASNNGTAVSGINVSYTVSATIANLYHNTIYLSGTSSGTGFGSAGIYANTGPTTNLRNNIIINNTTPTGSGKAVAYRRSSTALTTYATTSNNNIFYAGATPSSAYAIFYDGTNLDSTFTQFKSRMSPRDVLSVNELTNFISTSAASPYFMQPDSVIPTAAESGGQGITGVTTDFNGNIRAGNTGYSGTGTAPDMGAFERNLTPADVIPPAITYTALTSSMSTGIRTITATITDVSGVPTSGSQAPTVYFRRLSSGNYAQTTGTLSSGTATNGTWTFTIDPTLVGGVSAGDTVYYFIVAQDASVNGNMASVPAGAAGFNPSALSAYPAAPASYRILSPINGTFLVGASQSFPNYTTLTSAMADIGSKIANGNITLVLQGDYNSSAETFPIVLPFINSDNGNRTITIKPAAGVNAVISGSNATAIIKFANNAVNYIIDGSNNGTNSRNLFIQNTLTTTSSVVLFEGLAAGQGVRNTVLKNTVIKGGSNSNTFGVLVGGNTISSSSAGNGHNNITVSNNQIYNCYYAATVSGTAVNSIQNITISQNDIGTDTVAFYNRYYGVYVTYADNIRVLKNKIFNVQTATSISNAGVGLAAGTTNSTVKGNTIYGIYSTSTSGYAAHGIYVSSATSVDNDSLINNVIYDIITSNYSASSSFNPYGIRITGGTNLKIYYNSINLFGQPVTGTAASASYGLYLGSTTMAGLDIRNNVFANSMTGAISGSKHYALWTVGAISGATFDYNDFYVSGPHGVLMNNNGTAATTLVDLKAATGANTNTISADPLFNSNTILVPKQGSPLLAAGVSIAGVTTDAADSTRANTPTIGGYEKTGDFSGPAISFTNLPNTQVAASYTLNNVVITDITGVNTTPGTKPRIYFKKTSEANVFGANNNSVSGWKWTEATNSTSPFSFTINHNLLSSSLFGHDTIQYFIVAQDITPQVYVGASPSVGFAGTSVSSITSAPVSPAYYIIVDAPMTGTYQVGNGGAYATLTAAVTEVSQRGMQGDVTLEIVSNITEPAGVVISPWNETGTGNYRLSIVPSASTPLGDTIFASATSGAVITLAGADRVTLDGRISGSGNLLSVVNTSTGSTQYGVRVSSLGTGLGAENNIIRNLNIMTGYNSATTAVAVRVDGDNNHSLQILNNNISKAGYGIGIVATSTTAGSHNGVVISGNNIGSATAATYVTYIGINVSNTPGIVISKNNIFNIINGSSSGVYGIQLGSYTSNASIMQNKINTVTCSYYYYYYSASTAPAVGINLSSGTSADSVTIANNVISRMAVTAASTSSTSANPFGIRIAGGNTHKIVYNTVSLSGTYISSSGTNGTLSAALMLTATSSNLVVRNNIFANGYQGRTGSKNYGVYVSSSATFASIDNNNYDTTGSGSFARIGYKGSDALTIGAWRVLTGQDNASVALTSGFTSLTDFTINTGATPNALESGGAAIAGITTDFNGDPRPKTVPTTYGGNTQSDIGAYEFDGTPADLVAPAITYTAVSKLVHSTANLSLSIAITDAGSGVNTSFGTAPRVYYKKKPDANTYAGNTSFDNGWKWVEATNNTSPFNFVLNYSLLTSGQVSELDTIQYFVVSQDNASPVNITANPAAGFTATSVSAITAFPSTPNFYIIQTTPAMTGTYKVGPNPTDSFATLTSATTSLGFRGVSGPVTFELTGAAYTSATETFPIVISEYGGASATNTLTIRPAAANNATITGSSSTSIININGGDYVIIDGSNNGSTSQNLTIENTSNVTTSAVLSLSSASVTDSVTNVTVKNCVVNGDADTTFSGIHIGGTAIGTGAAASSATNITIQNNKLDRMQYGIFLIGRSATIPGTGNTITGNQVGLSSGSGFTLQGIHVESQSGLTVSKNTINNLHNSSSSGNMAGILATNIKGSAISSNTIDQLNYTGNTTGKLFGISVISASYNTSGNPSNNTIVNNMISNLTSTANSSYFNTIGLNTENGYGDKFYFNTVNLTGQMGTSTGMSAAFANGNELNVAVASAVNVRNNIFIMAGSSTGAAKLYATTFYTTGAVTSSTLNYNNLVASVTGAGTGYIGGTGTTSTYSTLAAWKTATGQEANSQSTSVVFTAPNNLHLAGASVGNVLLAGTPISGITTDIDGQTRHASYPYMGADENTASPLPVSWLSFTGTLQGKETLLSWSTASEQNNKGFEVERSADNKTFVKIGFVNGQGNSDVVNHYSYTDQVAALFNTTPVVYYRLRQVDMNGKASYSSVVAVQLAVSRTSQAVQVYPNPAEAGVNLSVNAENAGDAQVVIADVNGKVLLNKTVKVMAGGNTISLEEETAAFNSGVYFIQVQVGTGSMHGKFIKQ